QAHRAAVWRHLWVTIRETFDADPVIRDDMHMIYDMLPEAWPTPKIHEHALILDGLCREARAEDLALAIQAEAERWARRWKESWKEKYLESLEAFYAAKAAFLAV